MNLSVETQLEVIFLEDLCKIFFTVFYCFNLPQNASECVSDTLKSQYFQGGGMPPDPPSYAGRYAPGGAAYSSQISTPKPKNLSTALAL